MPNSNIVVVVVVVCLCFDFGFVGGVGVDDVLDSPARLVADVAIQI